LVQAIAAGSGAFQHGHTYLGHAMACAAALAVQQVIRRDSLVERVQRQGEGLRQRLQAAFGEHPHVGDIRGRGLFQAIELVEDRARQTPFDPTRRLHARVKAQAMAEGLMVYPMGGTIDGRLGDHVLLAPPFIVDDDALDQIVGRLQRALARAIAG
jgi:adenosylmethionine-8-amino-7-oxononanoate aminotransferase